MMGMRSNTYLDYHTTTLYQLQRLDSFQKRKIRELGKLALGTSCGPFIAGEPLRGFVFPWP